MASQPRFTVRNHGESPETVLEHRRLGTKCGAMVEYGFLAADTLDCGTRVLRVCPRSPAVSLCERPCIRTWCRIGRREGRNALAPTTMVGFKPFSNSSGRVAVLAHRPAGTIPAAPLLPATTFRCNVNLLSATACSRFIHRVRACAIRCRCPALALVPDAPSPASRPAENDPRA